MDGKKMFKNPKFDDLSSLKSLMNLNGNILEMIKPAIKQKNNEIVMKMMDVIKDKPEVWFEYISIAIFHQNFPIMKYMIEAFGIQPVQVPALNPIAITSDILSDTNNKVSENKDNYEEVECPLLIQAAIGGDIDIYKYLIDGGWGSIPNIPGHITLSKKSKNSVVSNIIGAAAYYGRDRLLQYILENSSKNVEVNLNFKTIEKKIKTKYTSPLLKEFTDYIPAHLAIASEITEDTSIDIVKLLKKFNFDVNEVDWNRNNILHLAVKYNKLSIVKFIIEELKLGGLAQERNREGQTPMAIAQSLGYTSILHFLENNTEGISTSIESDLLELMETTKSSKKKGKKKKNEKEFGLLNSADYQESLKIKITEPSLPLESKPTEQPKDSPPVIQKEEEEEIEADSKDRNENLLEKEYSSTDKPQYERRTYYPHKDDDAYNNRQEGGGGGYYKDKGNYGYYYDNDYYYQDSNYDAGSTGKRGNYANEDTQRAASGGNNLIEKEKENSTLKEESSGSGSAAIIGLNKKLAKKNTKNKEKQIVTRKDELDTQQKEKEPIALEKEQLEDKQPKGTTQLEKENNNPIQGNKNKIIDAEEESEQDFLGEDDSVNMSKEEIKVKDNKIETVANETNQEKNEDQEQKERLSKQEIPKIITKKENQNPSIIEEFNGNFDNNKQMMAKCLMLEKNIEALQKEKQDLENYVSKNLSLAASNSKIQLLPKSQQVILNSEENIYDLLTLANEELDQKSKRIAELESKFEYLDGKNIKKMSVVQLNNLKEFYSSRLGQVIDSLNNLNIQNK